MRNVVIIFLLLSGLTMSFMNHRSVPTQQQASRPNILWITCEDMSPRLACYGDKEVKTPNLDQLAAEGVRYSHVYSTAGVCAPSRSAIITGMYQTSIGTQHMRTVQLTPEASQYFGMKGYSAVLPEAVRCFPEYLRKAGYYCTNNDKQDYQFLPPVTVWDESSKKAHWRNRPGDKPFFSVFNLMITHESQLWSRNNESLLVRPEDVDVPAYYPDTKTVRHDIARHLSNVMRMDSIVGTIIRQLKDDGLYDNTIIFFYSDHGDGLPFVKRELYDRGLRVPMIIRMPEKFRVKGSKPAGSIDDQLISFVDLAPTMLSLANLPLPTYLQGQAFLGEKKAAAPRKYIFAGRDRMDMPVDRVRAVSDGRYKYCRNFMPEKPFYQDVDYRLSIPMMKEMLQLRDEGKLNATQMMWFRKTKPVEELYDTQTDPNEFTNLIDKPAYKAKLTELRGQMDAWLKKVGDRSAVPEKEMIKQMWNGASEPPRTAQPEIVMAGNAATIRCATPGASVGYVLKQGADQQNVWQVYGGEKLTLQTGDSLRVVAQRIGYLPSAAVKLRK
ncbi:sulfatase family protein [Spirosoma validum]|uniref:Sulfatase n=1 Tax=Spirosoma validum TaxID=2771355 RepID=A0A927GFJ2_9BACT|nr:sulfatase [Spirosoma validum]MBD2755635.1 sulfatase [Spirosoma validum]